ncbi:MAG: T9SS type A sorting domain-containing protein [Bacteroidia bacterium]
MTLIAVSFFLCSQLIHAQGGWTRKADIGTEMDGTVCFCIGTKCYTVTGHNNSFILAEFWEWDQATDTWIRKADFPGVARYFASGFSIGTKGYIGVGFDGTHSLTDFWEWDQATDSWTRKADFPGIARHHAVGFSVNSKGYIGTGWDDLALTELKDFWEWDPATDSWTRKSDFGGTARQGAASFVIGNKAYVGTGEDQFSSYATYPSRQDLWEWDQATDTWTQKADLPGPGRYHAPAFAIGNSGYILLGKDKNGGPVFYTDFWKWDQLSNTWSSLPDPGIGQRWLAFACVIGTKAYVGCGRDSVSQMKKDLWEYQPALTTGVTTSEKESISISPNPNNGVFSISAPGMKYDQLEICDMSGNIIYRSNTSADHTEVRLAQKGIYVLRIFHGGKLISREEIVVQ